MENRYKDSPQTLEQLKEIRRKNDQIWQAVIDIAASDMFSDLTEEARIGEIWKYAEKLYNYGQIKDLV